MSNAVVAHSAPPTPSVPMPAISQSLRAAILASKPSVYPARDKTEADHVIAGTPPSKSDQAEAHRALADMARQPMMTWGVMGEFLGVINIGVAASARMSGADIRSIVPVYVLACEDLPASALGETTYRDAVRAWKWFPSAAEVGEFARHQASAWLAVRADLQAITTMQSREEHDAARHAEAGQMSDAERVVMGQRFEALRRELDARIASKRHRAPIKSVCLTPEQLRHARAEAGIVINTNGENAP